MWGRAQRGDRDPTKLRINMTNRWDADQVSRSFSRSEAWIYQQSGTASQDPDIPLWKSGVRSSGESLPSSRFEGRRNIAAHETTRAHEPNW